MDPKDPNQIEENFPPPPPPPSRIEQILEEEEQKKKRREEEKKHYGFGSLATPLTLAFLISRFKKTKVIEQEKVYKEVEKTQKEEWLKNNPGKNFNIYEGIDYVYGSLDNPQNPSLHQDILNKIKEYGSLYDQDKKQYKHYEKYKKLLEKYGKKKEKENNSAEIAWAKKQIKEETEQRFKLLKQDLPEVDKNSLIEKINSQRWTEFIERYPKTAKEYAQSDAKIKKAYENWEAKEEILKEKKETQKELSEYQKDIKYVEKTHRPQELSQEEIAQKLQGFDEARKSPSGLIDQFGRQIASSKQMPQRKEEEEEKKEAPSSDQLRQQLQKEFRDRLIKELRSRFVSRIRNVGRNISRQRLGTRFINRANNLTRSASRLRSFGGSKNALSGIGRGGVQSAARIGSQAARLAPLLANPIFWIVVGVIILIIITAIIILLLGGGSGFQPPEQQSGFLDYTISFRDSSISPSNSEDAKQKILSEFPKAQLQYWERIIEQSRNNNWNPAFVLSLWIEETGSSHYTKLNMGGGGATVYINYEGLPVYSNGHLGCAPNEDQNIDESLRCLFKNFSTFDNSQFEAFMRRYSGEQPTGPFVNNPNFPKRIKKYYSMLIPSGSGAITLLPSPASRPISQGLERVFYCQGNPRWDNRSSCGLGSSGCGPTSVAIVLSSFGLKEMTPPVVDAVFGKNGWRPTSDCLSRGPQAITSDWLKNLGFTSVQICYQDTCKNSLSKMQEFLNSGYLIVGSSQNYPCANCRAGRYTVSHIFVIEGLDADGTLHVIDPNNCDYATGLEGVKNRVNQANFTWYYAYAVKRVK